MRNMEPFCTDQFWDWNLTWGNQRAYPEFTECFRSTVVQCLGSMWLWLCCPVYLCLLLNYCRFDPLTSSWLSTARQSILVIQLAVRLLQIKLSIDVTSPEENGGNYWNARCMGLAAEGIKMAFVLVIMELERRMRFVTSAVLSIYWLLTSLSAIVMIYSEYVAEVDVGSSLNASLLRAWFGLAICQLALCFYTDCPPTRSKKECPLARASFFSRIIYSWMDDFMTLGYNRPLEPNDFSKLMPGDQADAVIANFDAAWNKQVQMRAQKHVPQHKKTDESTSITEDISLIRVLIRAYGPDMVGGNILRLVALLADLAQPTLIGFLISLAEDATIPTWKGFVFLAAFLICLGIECVALNYVHHLSLGTAQRMKSALTNAIFNKSLRMTNRARSESTVGEIVNLVSTDLESIDILMGYLWAVWEQPLYIVACFILLYKSIGIGAIAGLAVLIVVLPFNLFLSKSDQALHQTRMDKKDARIKLLTEIFNGIRILKLYAWELAFGERIKDMRQDELVILKRQHLQGMIGSFSWCVAPFMMGLVSLATYIYVNDDHVLTAQTAFSSLMVLGMLAAHFHHMPYVFGLCMKGAVGLGRVHKFLNKEDIDPDNVTHNASDDAISIKDGTFTWDPKIGPVLKEINMTVSRGSLVAVVGRVGMGKSTLLSAILGEVEKNRGDVNVDGEIAYVPQQAWIQNDTLQNNILFGRRLNPNTYKSVIEACALVKDLDILPGKDQTEIGEKGINLSGGQKQRVSMARAVYHNADIYLLDDPLSAVDAHVGKHIFDHVIGSDGFLRNKTRVLVTHGLTWLKDVDKIFVMDDRGIAEAGSYKQLVLQKGAFARFIKEYKPDLPLNEDGSDVEDAETATQKYEKNMMESGYASEDKSSEASSSSETEMSKEQLFRRSISRSLSLEMKQRKHTKHYKDDDEDNDDTKEQQEKGKFIDDEEVEVGKVQMKYITPYIKAIGITTCVLILIFFACFKFTNVAESLWLKEWTDNSDLKNATAMPSDSDERKDANMYYIGVYASLGLFEGTMLIIHEALLSFAIVRGAAKLHEVMLVNVMRGKMSFFDSTPVGRIVNRFSQDMDPLDGGIVHLTRWFLHVVFGLCSIFAVIMYSIPKFVVMALPVSLLYFHMQKYFVPARRQLKRLQSKKRSPIFSHFSESLNGCSVIRAFGCQTRFSRESAKKVDAYNEMRFHDDCIDRWMCIRLDGLNLLCFFVTVCFSLSERDFISGAVIGLLMNYALRLNGELNGMIRVSGEIESSVVSIERIGQYSTRETEAALHTSTVPPKDWPDKGELQIKDYSLRYRPETDLVLKGVNFSVRKGERIGIVGRTGAGKSSLTIGLFRLVEPAEGSVHIDGYDVSEVGLFDLRSNLTILPQEPVLFSGTLRSNLDPMNVHSDETVYHALQHAHLKDFVTSLPDKLEYECGEGGTNLSVGQRQLICLARSLLRKSKVLLLDEATAAVDLKTDELIQNTIKAEFKDCTVLTIAHRLNTIIDYDRILVLSHGEVMEFDSPKTLLQNKNSMFYSMAKDANLVA